MNVMTYKKTAFMVTAEAAERILSLMSERDMEDYYLRVFVDGLGCSGSQYGMAFSEKPLGDDTVVESNGVRVLLDPFSLMCLEGAKVDFVDLPEGPDFKIDNPNEVAGNSACSACSQSCG